MKYVAFLRGINVGGHKKIAMSDLIIIFEKIGFTHVKTLLASGNVIFESSENDLDNIRKKIERCLTESLGYEIKVIVRTIEELQKIIDAKPFQKITDPKATLYVTFLVEQPTSIPTFSFTTEKDGFSILAVKDREIYSVVISSESRKTTDMMTTIEKIFGKYITTRNWNTICKITSLN